MPDVQLDVCEISEGVGEIRAVAVTVDYGPVQLHSPFHLDASLLAVSSDVEAVAQVAVHVGTGRSVRRRSESFTRQAAQHSERRNIQVEVAVRWQVRLDGFQQGEIDVVGSGERGQAVPAGVNRESRISAQ